MESDSCDMLRILLVDDEKIILNGIRQMIQKGIGQEFSIEVAIACSVPEAMKALDSFVPDLILTDIRMPIMDGFELIRHVRERNLTASIVVLTSHADFEYAQQAIRLNVMDFIVKPIDQQILMNTIRKVYEMKEKKEQQKKEFALNELRNVMLYDLAVDELISDTELIRSVFPHSYFAVIVAKVSQIQEIYREHFEQLLLRHYECCNTIVLKNRNLLVGICNSEKAFVKTENIMREFRNATSAEDVLLGVSVSSSSYKQLHDLYINALQRIWGMESVREDSILTEMSLFSYHDCINIFMEKDETMMLKLVQEYLAKIRGVFKLDNEVELVYHSFVRNILMYLGNNNISISQKLQRANWHLGNWKELADEIVNQLQVVKEDIENNQEDDDYKKSLLVKQMISFIQQNYQRDLSLGDLAEGVGLHPNYVCNLFKKSTGESYLSYLHKERLAAARKLIQETDYNMERIAAEVGYNSATQLARVFRKYEGIAPSTLRSEKKANS